MYKVIQDYLIDPVYTRIATWAVRHPRAAVVAAAVLTLVLEAITGGADTVSTAIDAASSF